MIHALYEQLPYIACLCVSCLTLYQYSFIMILFIGNLNVEAKKQDIADLFTPYGEIIAIEILKDSITHRSRGCGYIYMAEHEDAMNAVRALNNSTYMNKQLVVTTRGPKHPIQHTMLAQKKK